MTSEFVEINNTVALSRGQFKVFEYVLRLFEEVYNVTLNVMEMGFGSYGFDITAKGPSDEAATNLNHAKDLINKLLGDIRLWVNKIVAKEVENASEDFVLRMNLNISQDALNRKSKEDIKNIERQYFARITIEGTEVKVEGLRQVEEDQIKKTFES